MKLSKAQKDTIAIFNLQREIDYLSLRETFFDEDNQEEIKELQNQINKIGDQYAE